MTRRDNQLRLSGKKIVQGAEITSHKRDERKENCEEFRDLSKISARLFEGLVEKWDTSASFFKNQISTANHVREVYLSRTLSL